jgi:hypothetical protein
MLLIPVSHEKGINALGSQSAFIIIRAVPFLLKKLVIFPDSLAQGRSPNQYVRLDLLYEGLR